MTSASRSPTFEREGEDIVADDDDEPDQLSIVSSLDASVEGTLRLSADRASGTLTTPDEELEIELEIEGSMDQSHAMPGDLQATIDPQELPPEDHGSCLVCDASCKETSSGWVCKTWNCKHIAC